MSISESVQVASRAGNAVGPRGLVPLLVVLALGLALLVVLLSIPSGGVPAHHVVDAAPHIAR
jgi:hypothetical protein